MTRLARSTIYGSTSIISLNKTRSHRGSPERKWDASRLFWNQSHVWRFALQSMAIWDETPAIRRYSRRGRAVSPTLATSGITFDEHSRRIQAEEVVKLRKEASLLRWLAIGVHLGKFAFDVQSWRKTASVSALGLVTSLEWVQRGPLGRSALCYHYDVTGFESDSHAPSFPTIIVRQSKRKSASSLRNKCPAPWSVVAVGHVWLIGTVLRLRQVQKEVVG